MLLDLSDGAASAAAAPWADHVDTVSATMADPVAAAVLIRPDGYVAWAADTFEDNDGERLRTALQR